MPSTFLTGNWDPLGTLKGRGQKEGYGLSLQCQQSGGTHVNQRGEDKREHGYDGRVAGVREEEEIKRYIEVKICARSQ